MQIDAYRDYLRRREAEHRLRGLAAVAPAGPGRVRRGGRELVDFASNDYLGLARDPRLAERARAWTAEWGTGARASRLITGELELFARVEGKVAAGKRTEAALVFASGFQANASVLPALFDRTVLGARPLVFSDRLNHASIHHGCAAAGVKQIRYRHNDPAHLDELLERHAGEPGPRFILTESVFSMDGDVVDLEALLAVKERHGAFLYLDEAHATGVLGPDGFGLSAAHPGRVDLAMGTFSKALGGFGAYVACSSELRDYLVNRASGLIYSTALPPAVLGAMDAALDLLPGLEERRYALRTAADRVRASFCAAGLDTGNSATPIVPVRVGDDRAALDAARALEEEGLLAIAIRPPTVPEGTARIRFTITADHTAEDLDRLFDAVPRVIDAVTAGGAA